jgi:hypothetical protein
LIIQGRTREKGSAGEFLDLISSHSAHLSPALAAASFLLPFAAVNGIRKMPSSQFPNAVRYAAVLWLLLWVPAYWRTWGPANFLHLCDVAVFLTCLGLWRGSALLLSTQVVSALVADALWTLDALSRLFSGRHLLGGTEYLFDPRYPLFVRLPSLFHVAIPIVLLWSLRRTGYGRRALLVQTLIAASLLVLSRFFGPALNLNFAFRAPFFQRPLGPAPVHLLVMLLSIFFVTYLPAHWLLLQIYPPSGESHLATPDRNSQ